MKQLSQNHAYRDYHSTTTMLLDLMDTISTAKDSNLITAMMSMGLTAAFDCVQHKILLQKLTLYGLDSDSLKWIEFYLGKLKIKK